MSNSEIRAIFYYRNPGETYPGEPVVYRYVNQAAYQIDMDNKFNTALTAIKNKYPNKEIFPNAAYFPDLTKDQTIINKAFNSPLVN